MAVRGAGRTGDRPEATRGAWNVRGRRLAVRPLIVFAALLVGFGLAGAAPSALAAGRAALVVGNGTYAAIGALPNAGNDAADMAAALGRLGFDVRTVRDADLVGMNESLRLFARASAGADVAVVFYAGHGLEVDGVNYLVPVDARLERDTVRTGSPKVLGRHRPCVSKLRLSLHKPSSDTGANTLDLGGAQVPVDAVRSPVSVQIAWPGRLRHGLESP